MNAGVAARQTGEARVVARTTTAETVLEAAQLSKSFGEVRALDRLDLRVGAGEIVCLLGANGAGKTTAVNLFLGFLSPDGGEARVAGNAVHLDVDAARAHLGYIPDQVSLYPLLSGAENLAYFARIGGRHLSDRECTALLERSGLAVADAAKRVRDYSKGMRQKVGIAIALAKRASALILDEPLSGLDPLAANEFGLQLKALKSDGTAILMVTHDIFRAREIADRVGIMKRGRLVEIIEAASISADALDRLYAQHMHG